MGKSHPDGNIPADIPAKNAIFNRRKPSVDGRHECPCPAEHIFSPQCLNHKESPHVVEKHGLWVTLLGLWPLCSLKKLGAKVVPQGNVPSQLKRSAGIVSGDRHQDWASRYGSIRAPICSKRDIGIYLLSMSFILYLVLLFTHYTSTWGAPHVTTAQVNLTYEIHQGWLNTTGNFYNFSNIPYAAPPVGNLRFLAPTAPTVPSNPPVNDGSRYAVCPQGIPLWTSVATDWLTNGIGVINQSAGYPIPHVTTLPPVLPGTSEDCLLLDVLVPKTIFDNQASGSGAPVVIWIHGGGFTLGWKTQYGSGVGLLKASQAHGKTGVIYVAINYRLGLFGFLSGPTFSSQGGTANNGLLDQRMAIEWVQANIHKFGGDPSKVTVMGESAGGGSTIHQVTAYGGLKGKVPFQKVIIQSGAFLPVPGPVRPENIFEKFLARGNLTDLSAARAATTKQLQLANAILVGEAPFGDFTFNPVVDGSFAPDLPGKLLLSGGYDKSLTLLIGHNDDEGLFFTSPFLPEGDEETFEKNVVLVSFPDADATNASSYILNTLYPPIFDGSQPSGSQGQGYTNEIARGDYIVSEALFACNAEYLARAFGTSAYAYDFSVPPALHGNDIPYTFYEGPATAVLNGSLALIMQDYFTNFMINGNPNRAGLVNFPNYGSGKLLLDFFTDAVTLVTDFLDNDRCTWWQKALFLVVCIYFRYPGLVAKPKNWMGAGMIG